MKLSRKIVMVSSTLMLLSLACYICPLPAFLLSDDQANEVLLAVFGAAVSALGAGYMEYRDEKRRLEDSLLEQAEPLVSALGGLRECIVESLSCEELNPIELLIGYFEEESSSHFRLDFLSCAHEARDRLIREIEKCDKGDCEKFAIDGSSSFCRYIERANQYIASSADSYLSLAKVLEGCRGSFMRTLAEIEYLPSPRINESLKTYTRNARKTRSLKNIRVCLESIEHDFEETIGYCRLLETGDTDSAEILRRLKEAEKKWHVCETVRLGNKEFDSENRLAFRLFSELFDFASQTSSPVAERYSNGPWWL